MSTFTEARDSRAHTILTIITRSNPREAPRGEARARISTQARALEATLGFGIKTRNLGSFLVPLPHARCHDLALLRREVGPRPQLPRQGSERAASASV